jgi:hypothetical protein
VTADDDATPAVSLATACRVAMLLAVNVVLVARLHVPDVEAVVVPMAVPFNNTVTRDPAVAVPVRVGAVALLRALGRLMVGAGVFQKRRFLLDDRRTESFRLFIGLNNYRLKTVRPCERL